MFVLLGPPSITREMLDWKEQGFSGCREQKWNVFPLHQIHSDTELINQNVRLSLKGKENGKLLFVFPPSLVAYVSNINVFICSSWCTGTTNSKWIIFTLNLSPVHFELSIAVKQGHKGRFEDESLVVLKSNRHGSRFTTEKRKCDLGGFGWHVDYCMVINKLKWQ